jgi:hypothetical protein
MPVLGDAALGEHPDQIEVVDREPGIAPASGAVMVWRTVMRARSAGMLSARPWSSSLPEATKPTSASSVPEKALANARSVALTASWHSAT